MIENGFSAILNVNIVKAYAMRTKCVRWRESMREFWKKRLPALLMALLMAAGTAVPAAADDPPAEHEHQYSDDWANDVTHHWHKCLTQGCTERKDVEAHVWGDVVPDPSKLPTCYQSGEGTRECTKCEFNERVVIPATGAHIYDPNTWITDATQHWHGCTATSGCPAKQDTNAHTYGPSYPDSSDATLHWKECTVCGYVLKEPHVDANNDGVCDVCFRGGLATTKYTVTFMNGTVTHNTQSINKNAKPTAPATPTKSASNCSYTFRGWTTSNPGAAAAYAGQALASVNTTPVTANITYYAVYTLSATNQNASMDVSGTAEVTVGSTVQSKINSAFSSLTGRNFVNVTLGSLSTSSYGMLYANSSKTSLARTYAYSGGSYPMANLYFVPTGTRGAATVAYSATDGYSTVQGTLTVNSTAAANTRITYTVRPGQKVSLDRSDFNRAYQTAYSETVRWVQFTSVPSFSTSDGAFYYNYGSSNQQEFSRTTVDDYGYYYSSSSYGTYPIDDMSFVAASSAAKKTISVSFRAYYSNSRYVDGVMDIQISGTASTITYQVSPGEEAEFDRSDFSRVFQDSYSNYDLRYVTFTSNSVYDTSDGTFYYDYGGRNERSFTRNNFTSYTYYYNSSSYGDYPLDDLSFVASSSFTGSRTLTFRAYYDNSRYMDGTLVIQAKEAVSRGDIRYNTTGGTNVQINPNDIARFLSKTYSGSALQSVKLGGVPDTGTLYYNYYGVSSYGASSLRLTSANCGSQLLYFSPSGTSQYALSELTYVPSGTNYCAVIPFTAYGSSSRTVSGNILISVNSAAVQDVYGATPMNTSVAFPADAIYNAVAAAASYNASMSSIQLLELPASYQGTIYVGTGSVKATTNGRYVYSGSAGSGRIGDLRFMPASGFTGAVEIPYVAYNSAGKAIASGRFCLGIVSGLKSYKDVSSSVWCYKYVTELSDARVIDGYPDGYFRPDKTVTYGQALKLIMLAANYKAQAPTGKHPFSGYLARAKSDGLLTGLKESDLDRPISRLAVAQITAKAMKLSLSNLSSVKPFTDTGDVYVQALSAAGIVEGYFSNGTSTYKPANTMTRGQISAVVWRMNRVK